MMKIAKILIGILFCIIFASCSDDETIIDGNQELKSYELVEIQWRLDETDGQRIIEEKIPEFYFRNDADVPMPISIKPLEDWQGSSMFRFNDSLTFKNISYKEVNVFIPKELSLLSEQYGTFLEGVSAPLVQEKSFFQFSNQFELSLMLNPRSTLTTNYTLFLRENKASFLATFRENTTGELLELEGSWTGLFFDNLIGESTVSPI